MSRTTDSLKYLFGRTGTYIDESGAKKPLPYDKKFLKKFFKSRLVDRLIKEGTNAFDVSRFAPVADYIDTLHIVYNTDGTVKEAVVITNVGTVIDCLVEVQFFYAMLYVTAGAKASDAGEWLGNNASNVIYYNKRSSYTGTAQWNAGRSIDGLDAVAYFYNDGTTTGICCETTDGNAGTFKLAQNMLYHLFNGANVEVIEGFSNAINNMVWEDDCVYMDGTFENLKTTDTTASEITLDLDWMINKWHCASINFSTDGDIPLNIIWPENLQGINTTNDGYTIWINAILTSECWVRLANNLAMHNDGDAWKATIKVEKEEQAVNLLTETKEMIETKGWAIDIPEPVTGFYTKVNLDVDTDKILRIFYYSGIYILVTSDGYIYTSSDGIRFTRKGQIYTSSETITSIKSVAQGGTGILAFVKGSEVCTDWYRLDLEPLKTSGTLEATEVSFGDYMLWENYKLDDGCTYPYGCPNINQHQSRLEYSKTTSKTFNNGYIKSTLDGLILGETKVGVEDTQGDVTYVDITKSCFDGVKMTTNHYMLAMGNGLYLFDYTKKSITTIKSSVRTTNIDRIAYYNSAKMVIATGGIVVKGIGNLEGDYEDTNLTYTNTIDLLSFGKNTYAVADGVLYKGTFN